MHDLRADDGTLSFEVDGAHLDAVIGRLHASGIRSLICHPPTLEQLFMRHYGNEPAGTGGR